MTPRLRHGTRRSPAAAEALRRRRLRPQRARRGSASDAASAPAEGGSPPPPAGRQQPGATGVALALRQAFAGLHRERPWLVRAGVLGLAYAAVALTAALVRSCHG